MTVYEIVGHPIGPSPDGTFPLPETLRIALQENGIGQNVDLTLPAPVVTEAEDRDVIA